MFDPRPRREARFDRLRTVGRSSLSIVALAVIVSSLLVAGAAGPVLATNASTDANAESGVTSGAFDGAATATDGDDSDEPASADESADLEAIVDEIVAEQRDEHDVPGITVAVVEGGEPVLEKGYGEANVASGQPVRADETSFVIGSVGKLVTWTAVMQGVEDGKLDLDEDVNVYLEDSAVEIPETDDGPVTLRHLGTHTAGFDTRHDPGLVEDPDEVTSLETALAENRPDRIRPPGETVSYSNYGAMLAGHVVAEAYDTTFEEYVQSELFGPLGMDHSTFAQPVPEDHPGELAAPHEPTTDGVETADRTYVNWRPAGSMSATATDASTFMSAHLEGGGVDDARILEPASVEAMHDTHHERHPAVNGWRYGFYEYGPPDADLIGHSGGTLHETSKLVLAPKADVGVFVSYNVRDDRASPNAVVDRILEAYGLLSEPVELDEREVAADTVTGSTERTDLAAGEYLPSMATRDGPAQFLGLAMRLSIEPAGDGRLESDTLGFDEREWIESEPNVYQQVDGHDVLVVEVEDGAVEAVHRNSHPMTTYEPVPVHERTAAVGASVGVALVGFLATVLWWLGIGTRRLYGRIRAGSNGRASPDGRSTVVEPIERFRRAVGRPAWLARAAGIALAVVSLGFAGSLLAGLAIGGEFAFVATPLPLRIALALAPLSLLLAGATAVSAGLAWYNSYWSRRARVGRTILAVLGIVFAWQLLQLGFV
ncbi:serine hydrolase domain-containing protein [Natrarchaeobius oligotrophus]|uniref:Class A beta-lactamase-related serine hydrolase n=1 Tax=Natrarchaeobius chitinivorans TaxID=1679083 RepID=A0A3N6M5M9_NATCH|nr:serine hydrolase domain-containing protein [Natrarchaeobius chitinivorans]RQG97387.1 class A beta-lactamase-related serine hydrolase [Natrarchaeobius chitinivorans]